MRRLLLICRVLVFSACAAWADGNVRILQVGLNGHCEGFRPCPVVAAVSNPYSKSLNVELQVRLLRFQEPDHFEPTQTYIHHLTLGPTESRQIHVPVQPIGGASIVDLTVRPPQGNIIGHDRQDINDGIVIRGNYLVGVLCREESLCKTIQAQIQLSGSPQDRDEKNRLLELTMQLHPQSQWWSYSAASTVVVAIPTGGLSGDERSALEWFARGGGNLVLLEEELADPTFLADYRQGPPAHEGVTIGAGHLYRVPRLSGEALGGLFTGEALESLALHARTVWGGAGLQNYYRTTFAFPGWWALLAWLTTYVLLVGVVNFVVLDRCHQREWGWLTVAGIAFLFVFALYWLASRRGPQQVTLDCVAVHHLDSRSPLAFTAYGVRIAVPRRQQVLLKNPATALLRDPWPGAGERWARFRTVEMGRQFTRGSNDGAPGGWDPLPNAETVILMQRRTSRDLAFVGSTSFPGTVHGTAHGQLRNDTGQRFVDAVFVDSGQNRIWLLGDVASGAEIDLSKARYQPLDSCKSAAARRNRGFQSKADDFVLSEFVCQSLVSATPGSLHQRGFYGLTIGSAESARPLGVGYDKREHAVIEVAFE